MTEKGVEGASLTSFPQGEKQVRLMRQCNSQTVLGAHSYSADAWLSPGLSFLWLTPELMSSMDDRSDTGSGSGGLPIHLLLGLVEA